MGVKKLIAEYPNFPKEGILFYDIHPVMAHPEARAWVLDHLVQRYQNQGITKVIGLESRGYYFGISLAHKLGLPFVPFRKPGKLPGELHQVEYGTEYSTDSLCVQKTSLSPSDKVVIIDDLLATGGTASAAVALCKKANVQVFEMHCHIELAALQGREKLAGTPFHSLLQY